MFKVVWENKNDGILDVCVTWDRYYNANVVIKVLLLLPMTKKKKLKQIGMSQIFVEMVV